MGLQVTEEDINTLKLRLEKAFGEEYEVEVHKEVSDLMGSSKETYDLVIFYHGDAICGVEYKYKAGGSFFYDRLQDLYINRLKKVGLKYGISYFGEKHGLLLWTKDSYKFESFSFNDMVIAIKGNQNCGARFSPTDVAAEISSFMPDELVDELNGNQITRIQSLFTGENLNYDEQSASMWLNEDAEDDLFKILLQKSESEDDSKHVCRYTSLSSLFLALKDGNHVMCSITCMNDKGETSYADKYVGYGAFSSSSKSIKENNDCFILSCCNKDMKDNLTMWRLYGNDGKGVCLEYDVDLSKIDNKEFFYTPVSYAMSMNDHPALDFIKKIRQWKERGWCFVLKRWYIWKHFFKSHLFKEEKEVRLLYIWTEKSTDTIKWIMDSTNNIASRICLFPMSDGRLPLTLTGVIIGPKCPDQRTHVDQFNYMNGQTKTMKDSWQKPAVRASKIEDYR